MLGESGIPVFFNKYKLTVCSSYSLNLGQLAVEAFSSYSSSPDLSVKCTPASVYSSPCPLPQLPEEQITYFFTF